MKYFEMFAGVGGFGIGIQNAYEDNQKTRRCGQEEDISFGRSGRACGEPDIGQYPTCVGFSEIDKYASQVLKYHYPNIKNYGDCTKINWSEVPDFDLLCGGSPCQDFSIAGKRAGIEGKRSGLVWEYIRCLEEKKPKYFIFENVKGLLSSGAGLHLATILSAFSEAGYSLWWQVLNAKDFGVPQNRERIFVVGYRTDIGQPPEIDIKLKNEEERKQTNSEKMYLLQKGVTTYARELLLEKASEEITTFSREQMQKLLQGIRQGIQTGESEEIVSYRKKIQSESEGEIQEVGEISSWLESNNNTGGFSGVVSAPTEEMLLLWDSGRNAEKDKGQVQQQIGETDDRQNGLIEAIRKGKSCTLLLSVQPYKERLFYSLGNGRDWQNIYQSEVATPCKSLSSILETEVPQKYFLSQEQTEKIFRTLKKESLTTTTTESNKTESSQQLDRHSETDTQEMVLKSSTLNQEQTKPTEDTTPKESAPQYPPLGGGRHIPMIGALRGRNPENPKSRKAGLPTEQMLELNLNGTSNTLTKVEKDNYVVETD